MHFMQNISINGDVEMEKQRIRERVRDVEMQNMYGVRCAMCKSQISIWIWVFFSPAESVPGADRQKFCVVQRQCTQCNAMGSECASSWIRGSIERGNILTTPCVCGSMCECKVLMGRSYFWNYVLTHIRIAFIAVLRLLWNVQIIYSI